jgi:hypothetical protein
MIDRKALWIGFTTVFVLLAAILWRVSLLPDWHQMPIDGPADSHTMKTHALFMQVFIVLFLTVFMYARKYWVSGTDEAVQSWRRLGSLFVIGFSAFAMLNVAFFLSRSLGYGLALDRLTMARFFMAGLGLLNMVLGNALPKMPGVSEPLRWFKLDLWQQKRQVRFLGKLLVAMGLALVGIAAFLPMLPKALLAALLLGLGPVCVVTIFWHLAKVKREPSPG